MTYKTLSTRTTPDGAFFATVEYNIDGVIHTAEIAISLPTEEQQIIDTIVNYAKNEKWKKDAIANLPNLAASLPLNQEMTIE
jgi:hypothetical protein